MQKIKSYSIERPKNFDIDQIFGCGQCFRFNKSQEKENTYCGVALSKYIEITQTDKTITFYGADEKDFNLMWKNYFDLDTNYDKIIKSFSDDNILFNAANFSRGIRILKQDKWEALCSFIISQNNNIPRIKGIIENISRQYGKEITCFDGVTRYAFPEPIALYNAGESAIFDLKTGFRAKYIFDAAQKICAKQIDLDKLSDFDTVNAMAELMTIKGVGPKVAQCTLLFGFSKYDAFPIDVWVKRILQNYYSDRQSRHFSEKNAGIAQQYLFYYERCKNNVYV